MAHLNIPLYRNTQTTRSRRVVWLSGFVVWTVVSLIAAQTWLSRPATLRQAPENARFALQFVPTQATWGSLERAFGGLSLVSGRSFFLSDLKALQPREFTIFIAENGNRMLAARIPSFPTAEDLDAKGIVKRELGDKTYLFSQTLTPVRPTDDGWFHPWRSVRNLFVSNQGTILVLGPEKTAGTISVSSEKLTFSLNKAIFSGEPSRPTVSTVAQAIFSPAETSDRPAFLEAFRPILGKDLMPTLETLTDSLVSESKISLYTANNKLHFRLSLPKNGEKTQDLQNLLRLWAAFRHPAATEIVLPDGTHAKELRADVASVTLESTIVSGHPALRATDSEEGTSLTAYETESENVVTDQPDDQGGGMKETPCGRKPSHLYLDLAEIRNSPGNFSSYVTEPSWALVSAFDELSISSKRGKTLFTLCF